MEKTKEAVYSICKSTGKGLPAAAIRKRTLELIKSKGILPTTITQTKENHIDLVIVLYSPTVIENLVHLINSSDAGLEATHTKMAPAQLVVSTGDETTWMWCGWR